MGLAMVQVENAEIPVEPKAEGSPRSKAPVFVLGSPRSGTTLLYHMLLSAGNFAVYRAESQVFNLLEPRFGDLKSAGNKRELLAAWRETRLCKATGIDPAEIEAAVMHDCHNAGDFLRIVMEAVARQQNVERWADCTPEHLLYLARIKRSIPNALILHVIRDGRDVLLSMDRQQWIRPFPWQKEKGLQVAGLYWEWIVKQGREAGRWLGADYLEVRFEELIRNPREALAPISRFIDQELDYDHIQRVAIGSVREPNSSFGAEVESGEFSPVERWRNGFSAAQLGELEALIGGTLHELGYPLSAMAGQAETTAELMRMRSLYRAYFETKLFLKAKTPLGRVLVTRDLSWV